MFSRGRRIKSLQRLDKGEKMKHASCLCGGIKIKFTELRQSVNHCHCSMCRKFHGAAFATYGTVERSDLVIEAGENLLTEYESSETATRTFCRTCGSSLFFQHQATPDAVDIALGVMDDEPDIKPGSHIFYQDRPEWSGPYEDGLPKFDTFE